MCLESWLGWVGYCGFDFNLERDDDLELACGLDSDLELEFGWMVIARLSGIGSGIVAWIGCVFGL